MSQGGAANVENLIKQAMRELWKLPQNKALTTQAILNTAIAKVREQQGEFTVDVVTRARLINEMIRERMPPLPPAIVQSSPQSIPTTSKTTLPPKVLPTGKPMVLQGKPMQPLVIKAIPQVKAASTAASSVPRALPTIPTKASLSDLNLQRSQELENKRKVLEQQQALEKSKVSAVPSIEDVLKKEWKGGVAAASSLLIAENVAKNSPAWLICESKPEAGKGAKRIQIVRAISDFVIDRFTMDLTKGQSYAYKAGEIQGLTSVSATPTLFGSMAPDQYLLPEPEHLDQRAIAECVELGVKLHLQAEMDEVIDEMLATTIEGEQSTLDIIKAFSTDEKMIKAKLKEMKLADTPDSRTMILTSVTDQLKQEIAIQRRVQYKQQANKTVMEKIKIKAEDRLRAKLTEKLQAVKLKEITYDTQVEAILKQGKNLSKEETLYIYSILQDWMGKKHVVKVADKVAGPNKPYAVLSITGGGQSEIRGFGIRDNTPPNLKSTGVVEYVDGRTRPSMAFYKGHHPRIASQLVIQSGGKLNEVEGKLNIQANWDLVTLLAFYQSTMGAKPPIPVVVNCTDGIDRTGMIMTALMILDKYNKGEDISVKSPSEQEATLLNLIEDLRKDRGPFFLRGTTDIPIAITLGYALIATQKQQLFQDELRKKADNSLAINELLERAKTIKIEQLKEQLGELQKRKEIPAAQQENITIWINLVDKGIEAYRQFNTANNTKDEYRHKFGSIHIQRDSESDGDEAKERKYPSAKEVRELARKGFKLDLLNKIKPIAPVTNEVLDRFYAKKGALYVYSLSDVAENTFEQYCRKELGIQDEDKMLAAKMLLIADIMLDRRPRIESEPLAEYEKLLKELIHHAERRSAGNIANQVAKSKNLQNALVQTHGHALRAAAAMVENNLQDISRLQTEFSKNKKQIMENNPAITNEIYENYRQKLEKAVAFYQKRIDALSEADRKLYNDLVKGKTIDFDEYKRAAQIMSTLLHYQRTDIEPLTEIITIYNSLLMYDAFDFSMPGRLKSAEFIKLAQNPARSEDLFIQIQADLLKVGNLRSLSSEIATIQAKTKAVVVEANDRMPYLDKENVANFTALNEMLRKNKRLNPEDIKLIEIFTNALQVFFLANNNHYLDPSSVNKSILEAARSSLQTACNNISDKKKKEIGDLLDEDKKLQLKFKDKINSEVVKSFTSILEGLELAKKAFVSGPISLPEAPTSGSRAPSVPVRVPASAAVSPEPLPKHAPPSSVGQSKALMAEMQQKLSERAVKARPPRPARAMTPMRNAGERQSGESAQKDTTPQNKGSRKTPPKGSM